MSFPTTEARALLTKHGFRSADPIRRAYEERDSAARKCHADCGEAERVAYRVLEAERVRLIDATGSRHE